VTAALRRAGADPRLVGLAARVVCARLVRESTAFLVCSLLRAPGIRTYTVRGHPVRVAIRHRSHDDATLAEVFRNHWYDPPSAVARALGQPSRVLDLGANIGLFGALAAALWPEAEIVAFEPDPANAVVHERAIAANDLGERWRLVRVAAGARDGEVRFAAGMGASSHLAGLAGAGVDDPADTLAVECRDVLGTIAAADLVKLDIEGGEWEILLDPRFAAAPPRVIVLEYHRAGCPSGDPRALAFELLESAGMRTEPIWHDEPAGVGMTWGWRP
jgi:FkbM family methyltransferase